MIQNSDSSVLKSTVISRRTVCIGINVRGAHDGRPNSRKLEGSETDENDRRYGGEVIAYNRDMSYAYTLSKRPALRRQMCEWDLGVMTTNCQSSLAIAGAVGEGVEAEVEVDITCSTKNSRSVLIFSVRSVSSSMRISVCRRTNSSTRLSLPAPVDVRRGKRWKHQ